MTPKQRRQLQELVASADLYSHSEGRDLIRCTKLNLSQRELDVLPSGLSLLTNLSKLYLEHNSLLCMPHSLTLSTTLQKLTLQSNQLSSLPKSISLLTGLSYLEIQNNPIQVLSDNIIHLRKLVHFVLEHDGIVYVKRAHRDISTMPCWSNFSKPYENNRLSIAQALRRLDFYERIRGCENLSDVSHLVGKWDKYMSIDLSSNKLSVLPESFTILTRLRQLTLSQNEFTEIPTCLFEMGWIVSLDFSCNQISCVPNAITKMTRLRKICANSIPITTFPSSILDMPWITQIDLSDNKVSFKIALCKMIIACVNYNILTFQKLVCIPELLSKLTNLKILNVSNMLLSEIPSCLTKMQSIESLDLSRNHISRLGNIGNLTRLVDLNIKHNRFPEAVGSFLATLDVNKDYVIYANQAMEFIPYELVSFPKRFESFNFSNNRIKELPDWFCKLPCITSLKIPRNSLTCLPPSISLMTKLTHLDVQENMLTLLPFEISGLQSIKYINIRENLIEALPQGLSLLSNLKELFIDCKGAIRVERAHHSITGIPCWSHIERQILDTVATLSTKLRKITLYDILYVNEQLSTIPCILLDLKEIIRVDFSFNKISELPESFACMTKLKMVHLKKNKFTTFPRCLLAIPSIEYIDLSLNQILTIED